jgi:hypothetical protein
MLSTKIMLREAAIALALMVGGFAIGKTIAAEPVKNAIPAAYGKISKQEVFWMYTMKTRFWDDGTRVTVYYQDFNSHDHKEFCTEVLGVTTERFATNVSTYINRGNAAFFIQANSSRDIYYGVSKTEGAIGYLTKDFVLVNKHGTVKKFKIED